MKYTPPLGKEENTPYIDGDPVAGIEGSAVPAAAIENPQREIENAIKAQGLTPDENKLNQLGTHFLQTNNPHKVTAAQVGAWSKDENKRVAFHTLHMGGRVEIRIAVNENGDYKERAIYGTATITPRFNKSRLYFMGSWISTLNGDDGSVVYGGIAIYIANILARENQIFLNTTQSSIAGDYSGMRLTNNIPVFEKSGAGKALNLKVTLKAGKSGGVSSGQDVIVSMDAVNFIIIEQEV